MAPWLAGRRVTSLTMLSGGFINRNIRLRVAGEPTDLVLRLYDREPNACAREVSVLGLVRGTVPVPDVLYAGTGTGTEPPHVVLRFVEGVSLFSLRTEDERAVAEGAYDAGRLLARLRTFRFPRPGIVNGALGVDSPFIDRPVTNAALVEHFTDAPLFRRRIDVALRDRVRRCARLHEPRVAEVSREPTLAHGDYNSRNILTRETREGWRIAAVLDWEFAIAASPFVDIGNFLRYEGRTRKHPLEPHFSRGLRDGGLELPDDWRTIARVMDLPACCELLGRAELPRENADELRTMLADNAELLATR